LEVVLALPMRMERVAVMGWMAREALTVDLEYGCPGLRCVDAQAAHANTAAVNVCMIIQAVCSMCLGAISLFRLLPLPVCLAVALMPAKSRA
jgi:hypothetical protein